MKKILIITILSLLLLSCGDNNLQTKTDNKQTEKVVEKFGDITKYIKTDITDEESDKLTDILKQRVERQAEIKTLITEATKENSEETYNTIIEKRKICSNRILPFVWDDNKSSFLKYCEKINFQIKKKLDELK